MIKTALFILLIVWLLIITFVVVYFIYTKVSLEKRLRDKRFNPRQVKNAKVKKNKNNTWLNYLGNKLDKEYLDKKLIHAGYPMGIKDTSSYIMMKGLFTSCGIIMGFELFNLESIEKSIILLVITTTVGFFFLDMLINSYKKSRINKIDAQIPTFLGYFDNYNKAGLLFEDILSTVIDVLDGELKKEVIRLNVQYSMSKNFEESIKEFISRLGTSEADSLEIKLRQCYFSGVYDDVISDEKEIIEKKVINDIMRQSKKFELYLSIAIGLLLFNLFLILIHPLTKMVVSNMDGIM